MKSALPEHKTTKTTMPIEEKDIRSVVKKCAERGAPVSEELASMFVSALVHSTISRLHAIIIVVYEPTTFSNKTIKIPLFEQCTHLVSRLK